MLEILQVADEYKLPIIADEVYYGLVFDDESEFHSFGNLTKDVPVIVSILQLFLTSHHSVVELFLKYIVFQDGDLVG